MARLLVLLLFLLSVPTQAQPVTALRAGAVLDVASGRVDRNVVILIRDGRIEAVGPDVTVPAGAAAPGMLRP